MRVVRTDFLGLDKMSYDELAEFAAELADYNAKLQETLQRRTKQFEGMAEMWVERGVENAKLRELVRDLWEACPADGYYCIYHCKHYDKESESHCKLEDRMRELEIEAG